MGLVRTLKDWALQAGAKHYANERIQKYGHMTNLQIDSATRTIHFEILLKGETTPLTGSAKYQPKLDGEKKLLKFTEIQTSREWVNLLIQDYLKTRIVELPEGIPQPSPNSCYRLPTPRKNQLPYFVGVSEIA